MPQRPRRKKVAVGTQLPFLSVFSLKHRIRTLRHCKIRETDHKDGHISKFRAPKVPLLRVVLFPENFVNQMQENSFFEFLPTRLPTHPSFARSNSTARLLSCTPPSSRNFYHRSRFLPTLSPVSLPSRCRPLLPLPAHTLHRFCSELMPLLSTCPGISRNWLPSEL